MSEISVENAHLLAGAAHNGQLGRDKEPYISHPEAVAQLLQGDLSKITGYLHDVVEDTDVSFEDLRKIGVPEQVIEALRLLSHPPKLTESEYLISIKAIADSGNQLAIDVKYADLSHNTDLSRIPKPRKRDFDRKEKYLKAKDILRPFISEYLQSLG